MNFCIARFALIAAALGSTSVLADEVLVRSSLSESETGATWSLDYGAFRYHALPADRSPAQRAGLDVISQPYRLTLGGRSVDLLQDSTESVDRDGLYLLQFRAPVHADWRTTLDSAGLKPIAHVHPYTWIVPLSAEQARPLAALPFVRAVAPLNAEHKASVAQLQALQAETVWRLLMPRTLAPSPGTLASLGVQEQARAVLNDKLVHVMVNAGSADAERLLADPRVLAMHTVPRNGGTRGELTSQLNVGNLNEDGLAVPGYRDWLTEVGLDGSGVRIANVDSGIHDTHPDLVSRMQACTGSTCGGNTSSGHGTHTAGIMAGDGSSGVMSNGFLRGLGVAPGAELVEQVYAPTFNQAGGMLRLMRQSFDNAALLSGNSWGPAGSPRGYDDDTVQVDIGVRDVNPDAAGHQSLTYVLSIMNGYGNTSTQGTPDEAKNLIGVGATRAQGGGLGQLTGIDSLGNVSGHGPALDGRRLPDLVAPGCSVDSTLTSSGYGTQCGTSMASPQVSGAVALFIEQYRARQRSAPSPALIKAHAVVHTRDLAGNNDANGNTMGVRPDSKQGWGRMDLNAWLRPGVEVYSFDQSVVLEKTGESWEVELQVDDPKRELRIMLVWTDAPGHGMGGSTPAWNNDLDLIVDSAEARYVGNQFDIDGYSQPDPAGRDHRHNVEGVFLRPTQLGETVRITVLAADLNSDALPATGGDIEQDFALVCVNCRGIGSELLFANGFEPLEDVLFNDGFEDDDKE